MNRNVVIILAVVGGVLALGGLVVCAGCGGMYWYVTSTPSASAAAKVPFELAGVPVPPMPDREQATVTEPEPGVVLRQMKFAGGDGPGQQGTIWLYLPPGEHAPGSLPCVLVAPAGTTLLHGVGLTDDGYHDETLPYVRAGFAVVVYSLDGDQSGDEYYEDDYSDVEYDDYEDEEPTFEEDMQSEFPGYAPFRDSMAGLVNGRNAIEFVLAKVPEVDPNRIFAAGHSSAGTLALLLGEHDPRLAGVAAYMPAYNVSERFGPALRFVAMAMPDVIDFVARSSPSTHADRMNCPVFLFTADDDMNVPAADIRAAASDLQSRGKDVTLDSVPTGDHYQAMIDAGIPKGIEWMKTRRK